MNRVAEPFSIQRGETTVIRQLFRHSTIADNGLVRPNGLINLERYDLFGDSKRQTLWSADLLGINARVKFRFSHSGRMQVIDHRDGARVITSTHLFSFRRVQPRMVDMLFVVGETGFLVNPPDISRQVGTRSYNSSEWEDILVRAEYYNVRPPVFDEAYTQRYRINRFPFAIKVDPALAGTEVRAMGFKDKLEKPSNIGLTSLQDVVVIDSNYRLVPRELPPLFSIRYWQNRYANLNFAFAGPLGPLSTSLAST